MSDDVNHLQPRAKTGNNCRRYKVGVFLTRLQSKHEPPIAVHSGMVDILSSCRKVHEILRLRPAWRGGRSVEFPRWMC